MSNSFTYNQDDVISIEKKGGILIATMLSREVTMFTLAEIRATIDEALIEKPSLLILDINKTHYLDSSGIALIFRLRNQTLAYNGRFCISGLQGKLLTILEKILEGDDIEFFDTVNHAIKAKLESTHE